MKIQIKIYILALLVVSIYSCNNLPDKNYGKLELVFSHNVKADTFNYVNEAGNSFMVSEIQYFISDVKLYNENGDTIILDNYNDIHYVDTDIATTFNYLIEDTVEAGNYTRLSFTFGINEKKNKSRLFVNPPESFMFWPEFLGGGYHYMKLNGKWLDSTNQPKVFNFHLGIGQNYNENNKITSFEQNYFEVFPSSSKIQIKDGKLTKANIEMQVENWFRSPNVWNFNVYGGKIMQNQKAISLACENGHDVFLLKSVTYKDLQK